MTDIQVKDNLRAGLQKIETMVTPEIVVKLETALSLTITGIDDKDGFEAVDAMRKLAKAQRVAVDKTRKAEGEEALKYKRAVDSTAKRIITKIIAPAEEHCKAEIARINAEKERIETARRIAQEIADVWDLAHDINRQVDEQRAEAERLEVQRIEQERVAKELEAKQAEIARKEREAKIAKEAKEKAEREAREAAAQEKERLERLPDVQKMQEYLKSLLAQHIPVTDDEEILKDVKHIRTVASSILERYKA